MAKKIRGYCATPILNSYFQTGVQKTSWTWPSFHRTEEEEAQDPKLVDLSENYVKVDEIPFDFARRRLTTVVKNKSGKTQMVTKGAVEEMLSICSFADCDGSVQPPYRRPAPADFGYRK